MKNTIIGSSKKIAVVEINGKLQNIDLADLKNLQIVAGQKIKLISLVDGKEKNLDNFIVLKDGENLKILFENNETLTLTDFYSFNDVEISFSVADNSVYTISSLSDGGITLEDGTTLVYAQGDKSILMDISKSDALDLALANQIEMGTAQYFAAAGEAAAGSTAAAGGISTAALVIGGLVVVGAGIAIASNSSSSSDSSGSSSSSSSSSSSTETGYLVDSAVAGVTYERYNSNGDLVGSGVTDQDGKFEYKTGETIVFKLAGVTLGEISKVPSDGILMPQDILGVDRSDVSNPAVIAMAQFLQTLDADGDTSNGIQVLTDASGNIVQSNGDIDTDGDGVVSAAELSAAQTTAQYNAGSTLVSSSTIATNTVAGTSLYNEDGSVNSSNTIYNQVTNPSYVVSEQDAIDHLSETTLNLSSGTTVEASLLANAVASAQTRVENASVETSSEDLLVNIAQTYYSSEEYEDLVSATTTAQTAQSDFAGLVLTYNSALSAYNESTLDADLQTALVNAYTALTTHDSTAFTTIALAADIATANATTQTAITTKTTALTTAVTTAQTAQTAYEVDADNLATETALIQAQYDTATETLGVSLSESFYTTAITNAETTFKNALELTTYKTETQIEAALSAAKAALIANFGALPTEASLLADLQDALDVANAAITETTPLVLSEVKQNIADTTNEYTAFNSLVTTYDNALLAVEGSSSYDGTSISTTQSTLASAADLDVTSVGNNTLLAFNVSTNRYEGTDLNSYPSALDYNTFAALVDTYNSALSAVEGSTSYDETSISSTLSSLFQAVTAAQAVLAEIKSWQTNSEYETNVTLTEEQALAFYNAYNEAMALADLAQSEQEYRTAWELYNNIEDQIEYLEDYAYYLESGYDFATAREFVSIEVLIDKAYDKYESDFYGAIYDYLDAQFAAIDSEEDQIAFDDLIDAYNGAGVTATTYEEYLNNVAEVFDELNLTAAISNLIKLDNLDTQYVDASEAYHDLQMYKNEYEGDMNSALLELALDAEYDAAWENYFDAMNAGLTGEELFNLDPDGTGTVGQYFESLESLVETYFSAVVDYENLLSYAELNYNGDVEAALTDYAIESQKTILKTAADAAVTTINDVDALSYNSDSDRYEGTALSTNQTALDYNAFVSSVENWQELAQIITELSIDTDEYEATMTAENILALAEENLDDTLDASEYEVVTADDASEIVSLIDDGVTFADDVEFDVIDSSLADLDGIISETNSVSLDTLALEGDELSLSDYSLEGIYADLTIDTIDAQNGSIDSITITAEDVLSLGNDNELNLLIENIDALSIDGDTNLSDGISGWTASESNTSTSMTFTNNTNGVVINIETIETIVAP